jgi:hypothetical protein
MVATLPPCEEIADWQSASQYSLALRIFAGARLNTSPPGTVAVLTTLEKPALSRVALLTNFESSPQKSTVAIVTILHVATPLSFSIIQMKGEPAMMRFHDR